MEIAFRNPFSSFNMEKVEDTSKQPYLLTVFSIFASALGEAVRFTKQTDTFKSVCTKVEETKSQIYNYFPWLNATFEAIRRGKEIATKTFNKVEKVFYDTISPELRTKFLSVGYNTIGMGKELLLKGKSYLMDTFHTEVESDSESDSDDSKHEMSHRDLIEGNLTDYHSEEDSDYVPREESEDSLELRDTSGEVSEEPISENDERSVEMARKILEERQKDTPKMPKIFGRQKDSPKITEIFEEREKDSPKTLRRRHPSKPRD